MTRSICRRGRSAAIVVASTLSNAHLKLKWNIELIAGSAGPGAPSSRDGSSYRGERGRQPTSQTSTFSLRCAPTGVSTPWSAGNPAQFDIDMAARREFHALGSGIGFDAAITLSSKSRVIEQTAASATLWKLHWPQRIPRCRIIRSTNYLSKLFADSDGRCPVSGSRIHGSCKGVGRWDEAVAQLAAASLLMEEYGGNVDQLINLGYLYCSLGRPKDALSAIGSVTADTSPFGAMQFENVRLNAAYQLGDAKQIKRSLEYLRAHRADAPGTYEDALIYRESTGSGSARVDCGIDELS